MFLNRIKIMETRKILFSLGSIAVLATSGVIIASTTSCADVFTISVDKEIDEYILNDEGKTISYQFSTNFKSKKSKSVNWSLIDKSEKEVPNQFIINESGELDINPTEPGKYTFEVVATKINKPKNKATYQFTTIVNINVKGLENYTAGIRHGDPVATYNLSAEVLPATLSQEITWSVTSDQELDDVIKIDNNNQLVITPNTSSTETAKITISF